jgi:hypothetical protein
MSGQPISGHKGRDQWICAILTHHDLMTPLELRVAVRLGIFFNCKTGQCDPGYARLAKELCISKRSARRCVAALVAHGFVGRDEGAGGSHDQRQNFSLFMPSRGTDSVSPLRRTASVSPVETEKPDQHGGQKQGGTGDKNRGGRGTIRRPTKEPEEPEEPDSAALRATRTADADSQSANSTASDDATVAEPLIPSQRAPESALIETVEAQPQSSSATAMGTGPATDTDPAFAPVYRRGREVLGDDADAVITELLAAHDGYAEAALDTLAVADEESDPHQYVQMDIEAEAAARRRRQ